MEEVDDNESKTGQRMYVSPIVNGDNEKLEYEDKDGNFFNVFDEE